MKFKSIETSNKGLWFEVELGLICNYRCSYCPPYSYTGNVWIDHVRFMDFITKINPQQVLLVGGEPTLYPGIVPLLHDLKDKIVNMTSNGSKPISWWKSNIDYIDVLTLSYHPENANLEAFINKLKFLSDYKVVTVNVSMMLERFDECLEVGMEISKIKNVFVSLKALNDIITKRLCKYTDEQLDIMSKLIRPKVETKNNDAFNIHFYGKEEDGTLTKLRAQTVISNKENIYKGWKCWKGIQCIKLSANGNLYKSTCEIGGPHFGNIYDDTVILPTEPEICQRDYCYCLPDLKTIRKERIL